MPRSLSTLVVLEQAEMANTNSAMVNSFVIRRDFCMIFS